MGPPADLAKALDYSSLANKSVFITGGASGLGSIIAAECAKHQWERVPQTITMALTNPVVLTSPLPISRRPKVEHNKKSWKVKDLSRLLLLRVFLPRWVMALIDMVQGEFRPDRRHRLDLPSRRLQIRHQLLPQFQYRRRRSSRWSFRRPLHPPKRRTRIFGPRSPTSSHHRSSLRRKH